MKTKLFNRVAGALLACAMALSTTTSVFALDNTGGTPSAYNPSAHITVGKTLNTDQDGVFPDVTQFEFRLTAQGYTPGPAATGAGTAYTAYTAANLPMPIAVTGINPAAVLNADNAMETVITVAGFSKTATGTVQSHTAQAGDMTYTQTGVYTYRLKEIIPTSKVPGVTYDETLYFVNVYVTNILDSESRPVLNADGTPKVTVSHITAYKAENGATDPTAPDNNGNTPVPGATTGKSDIVTPAEGDGTVRNINYPFENNYTTSNVFVSKKVTGTLADPMKMFTFNIQLMDSNNAVDARPYNYEIYSMGADQIPYNTDDGEKVRVGTITTADRTFQLKHNEYIKIIGLAEGETYTVTEQDAQDYNTTVTPTNGIAAGTAVTVADGAVKTAGQQALATAESTFNRTDFVNSKDAVTPTGIALESIPFVLMIGAAGTALFLVLRKRRYNAR